VTVGYHELFFNNKHLKLHNLQILLIHLPRDRELLHHLVAVPKRPRFHISLEGIYHEQCALTCCLKPSLTIAPLAPTLHIIKQMTNILTKKSPSEI
jgi:hypothetical protein